VTSTYNDPSKLAGFFLLGRGLIDLPLQMLPPSLLVLLFNGQPGV
jgi:hypothetical protein